MHVNQVRITDKERTESWEEKVSVWKIEDIGEEKFNNWLRQMAEAICAQPDSDIKITFRRDKGGVAAVLSSSRIKSTHEEHSRGQAQIPRQAAEVNPIPQ